MADYSNFMNEIQNRDPALSCIIGIVRAHAMMESQTQTAVGPTKPAPQGKEASMVKVEYTGNPPSPDDPDVAYPYVLVMDRGDCDIFQHIQSQRIAGYDAKAVVSLTSGMARCLKQLHAAGVVHGKCLPCTSCTLDCITLRISLNCVISVAGIHTLPLAGSEVSYFTHI